MVILWRDNILWCRNNKSWKFKLDDDGNFFLGNQQLLPYLIQLVSILSSLTFGTPHHGPKAFCVSWLETSPEEFFRALIHTIWLTRHNVCEGKLFAPKLKFWPNPVMD